MISSDSEIEDVSTADSSECLFVGETSEDEFGEYVILLDISFKVNNIMWVRIMKISSPLATIKFIRLGKMRNTFMCLEIDDIASVLIDDIKTKLPEPKPCKNTKRGSS